MTIATASRRIGVIMELARSVCAQPGVRYYWHDNNTHASHRSAARLLGGGSHLEQARADEIQHLDPRQRRENPAPPHDADFSRTRNTGLENLHTQLHLLARPQRMGPF